MDRGERGCEVTTFEPIYGPIDSFPACEKEILKAQGILTILVLPLFAHGRLWGFVGFDDCSSARHSATLTAAHRFLTASAEGTPVDTQIPLDGMAHVLVRRVQEHLRTTVAPARTAGVLFRLSFPA